MAGHLPKQRHVAGVAPPFVLLDDARAGGAAARLYRRSGADRDARERWPRWSRRSPRSAPRGSDGLHAAGFLAYEAGAAFEPR